MKLLESPLRLALLLFCMFSTLQNAFADSNKYRIYAQVGETKYYMTGEPTRDGYIRSTTNVSEAMVFTRFDRNKTISSKKYTQYSFCYELGDGFTYSITSTENNNKYRLSKLQGSIFYFTVFTGFNGTIQLCPDGDSDHALIFSLDDRYFNIYEYNYSQYNKTRFYDLELEQVNSFDLTVSSAGYATLCLPFNADVPSGVELYAGSYANGRVTLVQPQSGKVHSGEGYIVRATPGTYTFSPISELFNKPEENKLVGVTERTDLDGTDGKTYIFKQQDGVVGFYRLTNTGYIGANKAYLKIDAPLDSRSSSRLDFE